MVIGNTLTAFCFLPSGIPFDACMYVGKAVDMWSLGVVMYILLGNPRLSADLVFLLSHIHVCVCVCIHTLSKSLAIRK